MMLLNHVQYIRVDSTTKSVSTVFKVSSKQGLSFKVMIGLQYFTLMNNVL